jgi:hypothetical protein
MVRLLVAGAVSQRRIPLVGLVPLTYQDYLCALRAGMGPAANVRRIFESFERENEIERRREANLLYLVVSEFCDVDRQRPWLTRSWAPSKVSTGCFTHG